ncbi:unnamed protein product, partial [Laminaria digitata]
MHRRFLNERDAFPKSADEHARQVVRLLQHRRAVMDTAWAELEGGWKANDERMVTLKVRPRTNEESVLKLNVGGSNVNVRWHFLAETEGFEESTLGALLEGVWGEGRIPRDADGRIVLDESPTCIKHIIHNMLDRASSVAEVGLPERSARSAVPTDEGPCLFYTAHVIGLPTISNCLKMDVRSTILKPSEIAPLGAKIREWVGGSTDEMTLIYRATRDGFSRSAFTARCNTNSPKTFSLLRVRSGQGGNDHSVVGGYNIKPFGNYEGSLHSVPEETFVFMLKDGSAIKWHPTDSNRYVHSMVRRCNGPYVGAGVLATTFYSSKKGPCTMHIEQDENNISRHPQSGYQQYLVEKCLRTSSSGPFLALDGLTVVEMEVYRCSTPAPPSKTAPSTTEPDGDALTDAEAHDIRLFGESIASSLMEERVVLDHAVKEMEAAGARVSAAVGALKTVYGPSVAAGEQDAVVELNVRGTGMTTLRSTLQACPRSALAPMFDEARWPATGKDKDQHGG